MKETKKCRAGRPGRNEKCQKEADSDSNTEQRICQIQRVIGSGQYKQSSDSDGTGDTEAKSQEHTESTEATEAIEETERKQRRQNNRN